ncbi:gp16 family protein [Aggregatibacter actinomycetemcomitans]|uniref:gp16 family protein n=1 Tax=Aggregatibacter actinomycetemcomitans TaxID=714 RepID=UPI001E5F51D9|nr:regulatory protein GemA [Aggregatibacter actinomycetemcomitans]
MNQNEARRKQLIQLIHIGKSKLQMDNEVYRLFLLNVVGKDSCTQMDLIELNKVVDAMKKRGFQVTGGRLKYRNRAVQNATLESGIVKKIRSKWLEMHYQGIIKNSSEASLNAYIVKIAKNKDGQPIPFVTWLDNGQAIRVLETLKKWQQRELGDI